MKESQRYFRAADEYMNMAIEALETGRYPDSVVFMRNCHEARNTALAHQAMEQAVNPEHQEREAAFLGWLKGNEPLFRYLP